ALLNPKKTTELKAEGKTDANPAAQTAIDKLVDQFLAEAPEKQPKKLEEYRDAKGVEYTEALARLVPQLEGGLQKSAPDCLAARLARMTSATLRERLKDPDAELRRAAAVACAMKEDKALIPELISALDDGDAWVVRAIGVALSRLTGQDYGPPPNASKEV